MLCVEHLLCRRHLQQSICTHAALAVSSAALSLACNCDVFEQGTVCSPGWQKFWQSSATDMVSRADWNQL